MTALNLSLYKKYIYKKQDIWPKTPTKHVVDIFFYYYHLHKFT